MRVELGNESNLEKKPKPRLAIVFEFFVPHVEITYSCITYLIFDMSRKLLFGHAFWTCLF